MNDLSAVHHFSKTIKTRPYMSTIFQGSKNDFKSKKTTNGDYSDTINSSNFFGPPKVQMSGVTFHFVWSRAAPETNNAPIKLPISQFPEEQFIALSSK